MKVEFKKLSIILLQDCNYAWENLVDTIM